MIKFIKKNKISKIIACYLAIQLILTTVQPHSLYALTSGPSQPEFNSFAPIGTSDMVNLSSGDFSYNIPIMDVGGYPLNLSYDAGITMDQESSWVGLGWNLNVGQINRQVRGIPDDFKGDEMIYENELATNQTIGGQIIFHPAFAGLDLPPQLDLSAGLGISYNNYVGWNYFTTQGVSYDISDNVTIGMSSTQSSNNGVSISPNVSLNSNEFGIEKFNFDGAGGSIGACFNSRQGLTSLSIDPSLPFSKPEKFKTDALGDGFTKSFATTTYTPTKRNKLINESVMANASGGLEVFFFEGQLELYAYGTRQNLAEPNKTEKAYGYNFTDHATPNDVLDFNRENERVISKHTKFLPITNYTYDLYSIQGQGVSGMFQPYRSQVGYVYDRFVQDESFDGSLGAEIGVGNFMHANVELKYTPTSASVGLWDLGNPARTNFVNDDSNGVDYETVYYKGIGELNVDNEFDQLYQASLGGEEPIKLMLTGSNLDKRTVNDNYFAGTQEALVSHNFGGNIKRSERIARNQSIQMISKSEANILFSNYTSENMPEINENNTELHHNVATKILQPDGSTYIFGQPAYNLEKREVTFNATGQEVHGEMVHYTSLRGNGKDQYFNRVTTPSYVHTYLLTEVLSSDYEDVGGDGPTDDDLGAYTKFHYVNKTQLTPYKWRVPYHEDASTATLNLGLNTLREDNMGNYIYGEKELFYVEKIETKTHVALFDLKERLDGHGVLGEDGGRDDASNMWSIDKVRLYAKPEYLEHRILLEDGNDANDPVAPIKTAHFEYDYSLCVGVPNNNGDAVDLNNDGLNDNHGGKLTLKKVYFTYRNSNMGKYTPYMFEYGEDLDGDRVPDLEHNPEYDITAYDLWGNYKTNTGNLTDHDAEPSAKEFPYVKQTNRDEQNQFSSVWNLKSINLPSGGKIDVSYESDTYAYVQNKRALQMFKVKGAGTVEIPSALPSIPQLYGNGPARFLYVELPNESSDDTDFINDVDNILEQKYFSSIKTQPIFFKFLMNMDNDDAYAYDYVSGYFKIDYSENNKPKPFSLDDKVYVSIPVKLVHRNKSENVHYNHGKAENPVAKAGWYFGRQYLNQIVYGQPEINNPTVLEVAWQISTQIFNMLSIFQGPNTQLKERNICKYFKTKKSWVRLQNPNKLKLGGGSRVSKIEMHDNWDKMTENNGLNLYKNSYGQQYAYEDENGYSYGVATFEPIGGKENPFIVPVYDNVNDDKLLAPEEQSFVEKPFGISFFPSPKITYSKVIVKNLEKGIHTDGNDNDWEISENGTGWVVHDFYTSYNFPTIAKNTTLGGTNELDLPSDGVSLIESILGVPIVATKRLSMSQGFMIITNDMDGKPTSQKVYNENGRLISGVDYKYNVDENENLINEVPTINKKGEIVERTIGVDYNVINDFKRTKSVTDSYGADTNAGGVFYAILFALGVYVMPLYSQHDNELRTATTTKVIHKSGFLVEKVAFDLGAEVSTKNIAWDAETGQVILTETSNEYKDHYFNFNYPAYWGYEGMGMASKNINIIVDLELPVSDNLYNFNQSGSIAEDIFIDGDEVLIDLDGEEGWSEVGWISEVSGETFKIITRTGTYIDNADRLKIVRSGYRNLQSASMASITLMLNPLDQDGDGVFDSNGDGIFDDAILHNTFDATHWSQRKIINASAIKYNDFWPPQCECELPELLYDSEGNVIFDHAGSDAFNPYIYNIKGDWRAKESFAYLTGRHNGNLIYNSEFELEDEYNPRTSGFFNDYSSYYKPDSEGNWSINEEGWTSASRITQYSPYGAELENEDALGRFSAAQYGFNYKFPVAVASNSEYRQIGFDGFEDYLSSECINDHFSFKGADNLNITDFQAHTGRYSVAVASNTNVRLKKRIVDCEDVPILAVNDSYPFCGGPNVTEYAVLANDNLGSSGLASIEILDTQSNPIPSCVTATVNNNGTPTNLNDDYIEILYDNQQPPCGYNTITILYKICDNDGNCSIAEIQFICSPTY